MKYKGVSLLSLPSLELAGVNTCSTGHSPMQERPERGVCELHLALAKDRVCLPALSAAGMVTLSRPHWRFVICAFWHGLTLTFSDENLLAGEECWRAQPRSARGLRARLPRCPFSAWLPPLCKHTPKAAGLSRSDYY